MGKIRMTVDQLSRLHEKIVVKGKQKIGGSKDTIVKDYCIQVKEDHLLVEAISHTQLAAIRVKWADFEDILDEGEIVIWSAEKFGDIPGRFESDDTLVLEDDGENLEIKREDPVKTLRMKSTEPETLDSRDDGDFMTDTEYHEDKDIYTTKSGIKLNTVVSLESRYLKDAVEDVEFVDADKLPVVADKGQFGIDAGDDTYGKVQQTLPVDSVRGSASASYQYGIGGITSNITGDIKLYFSDGNPMLIRKEGDDFLAEYLVTPVR